jgi:hypothetical protein
MEETLGGLDTADPDIRTRLRFSLADLPEDPTPEQVDVWVELAGMLQDPAFRARMRQTVGFNAADRGPQVPSGTSLWFMSRLVQLAGEALRAASTPPRPPPTRCRPGCSATSTGPSCWSGSRRWRTPSRPGSGSWPAPVQGVDPLSAHTEEFAWVVAALRARPAG